MAAIDALARSIFGIGAGQVVFIVVVAVTLIAAWALIRAALRIALRVFALGCVTILGIVLGIYVLFWIIR